MTTLTTPPDERPRAWAKGMYPLEAGVELLIRHGKAIYTGAPRIHDDGERAWLDVETLLNETGAWSGGEKRLVAIAASLIGEERVNLSEEVGGVDRPSLDLVLAAIAHANGSHEHSGFEFDEDGHPRIARLSSLYPWPESAGL